MFQSGQTNTFSLEYVPGTQKEALETKPVQFKFIAFHYQL